MVSFFAGLPEVSDTQIGAWGISYGGGQTWNGLAAGHPVQGRRGRRDVDRPLQRALAAERREVGDRARLREGGRGALAADRGATRTTRSTRRTCRRSRRSPTHAPRYRSSPSIKTPVYMFQGRVDYAFDVDAGAERLSRASRGPKHLYVGQFGHTPSTFPGPTSPTCCRRASPGSTTT